MLINVKLNNTAITKAKDNKKKYKVKQIINLYNKNIEYLIK